MFGSQERLFYDAYAHDINVASIAEELGNEWHGMLKGSQLGVFTFRTGLNVSMSLTTSECAREMRTNIGLLTEVNTGSALGRVE
ncbi:MAG: hypothetical protein KF843_07820 [Flavobacteriales bacterium]|nr:hypothetical protein [Flavobacteriales bacterium]